MSKVSDKVAKKRLLQLCDFLEKLGPKLFDYSTFADIADNSFTGDILKEPNLCGTTACALGWAPAVPGFKRLGVASVARKRTWGSSIDFTINGRIAPPFSLARRLFGLSYDAFTFLFHPGAKLGGVEAPSIAATAREVAEHIRNYVDIRYA